jgi:hypothetical protein
MRYDVKSVRVEEFKSGPRQGQRKPITLPKDATPVSVVRGYGLTLYYIVPTTSGGRS